MLGVDRTSAKQVAGPLELEVAVPPLARLWCGVPLPSCNHAVQGLDVNHSPASPRALRGARWGPLESWARTQSALEWAEYILEHVLQVSPGPRSFQAPWAPPSSCESSCGPSSLRFCSASFAPVSACCVCVLWYAQYLSTDLAQAPPPVAISLGPRQSPSQNSNCLHSPHCYSLATCKTSLQTLAHPTTNTMALQIVTELLVHAAAAAAVAAPMALHLLATRGVRYRLHVGLLCGPPAC